MGPLTGRSPSSGRWPTWAFFLGAAALFLGERVAGPGTPRLVFDALGAAVLVAAALARVIGWRRSVGAARLAEGLLALAHLGGLLAVALHFATLPPLLDALGLVDEPGRGRAVVIARVAWVLLFAVSSAVLSFVDRAYGPMRRVGRAERGRVAEALRAGLEVALATGFLFVVNYLATVHDPVADLSYFRTAQPGEATRKLVSALDEPLEVLLFFPSSNEVADQVRGYLQPLESLSAQLRVRTVDRLLDPAAASRYQVRADGTLVLARGERHERLVLGEGIGQARSQLRQLDQEFQQRLTRVLRAERVAYFTIGHGERGTEDPEEGPRPGVRLLKELLELLGYRTADLGLSQGLGGQIPEDAALIVVLGPRRELIAEEVASLQRWFQGGGRLLVALDPEGGSAQPTLLAPLGLSFDATQLAADAHFLRQDHQPSDQRNLVTDLYSSHASVATLGRMDRRLAVAFSGAGSLQRQAPGGLPERLKLEGTVRSLPETWRDADGDLVPGPQEPRREYELVEAVSLPVAQPTAAPAAGSGAASQAAPGAILPPGQRGAGEREGRASVFADSDALLDSLMRNPANQLLAADTLRWLAGDEALAGEVASEDDVPVQHTRQGEAVWFYGTVFAAPLAMLGLGLALRWRRRPR